MTLLLNSAPHRAMTLPADQVWPASGKWTYEDYCRIPNDGRLYEIIEGDLYMSPVPLIKHQRVRGNLSTRLLSFVEKHNAGVVMAAPLDVIFSKLATPVQPDIVFISKKRRRIIEEAFVKGAPDIIVEILSPWNWHVDRGKKAKVYAQAGVREYWIVDPDAETIELFMLRKGAFVLVGKYGMGETVRSEVLVGLKVKVKEVCEW